MKLGGTTNLPRPMLGRVFLLENLGVIMKKLRKLSKIIVLGLSLCLLASCTGKDGKKNDYIIGVVQIASVYSVL